MINQRLNVNVKVGMQMSCQPPANLKNDFVSTGYSASRLARALPIFTDTLAMPADAALPTYG